MSGIKNIDCLFEHRVHYPDTVIKDRLDRLVGLDDHKTRLAKMLGVLIDPTKLDAWMLKHYSDRFAWPDRLPVVDTVLMRPPLVILAGDVGSGKTELAETIGDVVARREGIEITLLPLSLSSRGQGLVGEMTRLLSDAFEYTLHEAKKLKSDNDRAGGGLILLVDEADALAQSREAAQMHHEDRAGVNAFIRGIDRLANAKVPAAVIMCTNRLRAIDPAVRRRAADILRFGRPTDEERRAVLVKHLSQLGFSAEDINSLVAATGLADGRDYGFTFSDLTQRLLPSMVLDAYPEEPVKPERAVEIASGMTPTAPFEEAEQ